ncbi:hypothetical protein KM043_004588 [Ampulex compressa]|nr:hypothetical protein KM043_004588 [Ampulex compressa]
MRRDNAKRNEWAVNIYIETPANRNPLNLSLVIEETTDRLHHVLSIAQESCGYGVLGDCKAGNSTKQHFPSLESG